MIVINKKFKVIVITLLILFEVASTYLMYRSFNNRNIVLDNVKLKGTNKNNGLAIMIEQEDGTYKESSSNAWPEEMMYNEEKSGCIDSNGKKIENSLTYEGGIATVNTNTTSYCYLYFDLIKDDITIAISTDGESGVMPSSGAYTNSTTCSSGNITWSDKYQRIEIGNLTKPTKCNLTFTKDTSGKTLLKTEVESKATTNVYGCRYSGKEPDNWIWFNNEMWRIIGSVPVTISDGTEINLVKIIRSESIGGLALDSAGANTTWGNNTLYTLLNSYYYGKQNGTGTSYCYGSSTEAYALCNYENIGISNSSEDYYGKMIEEVYWNVETFNDSNGIAEIYRIESLTKSSVTGKIGIMSAGDYGLATSGINYNNIQLYYLNNYEQDNWLYSLQEWTLSTKSTSSRSNKYFVGVPGDPRVDYDYEGHFVRPVVYLDSSVFIIEGNGSITNPYIIGM